MSIKEGGMKPFYAWAVVHSGDNIDCWDWRIPVYWYMRQAIEAKKKYTFSNSKVVRVYITLAQKRKS